MRWAFSGDECAGSAAASEGQVLRLNRKRRSMGSQRGWSSAASPMKNAAQFSLRGVSMFCWRDGDSRIHSENPLKIDIYLSLTKFIPLKIPRICLTSHKCKRHKGQVGLA